MPTLPLGAQGVGVGLPAISSTTKAAPRYVYSKFLARNQASDRKWFTPGDANGANLQYYSLLASGTGKFIGNTWGDTFSMPRVCYIASLDRYLIHFPTPRFTNGSSERFLINGVTGVPTSFQTAIGDTAVSTASLNTWTGCTAWFMPLRLSSSNASTSLCIVTDNTYTSGANLNGSTQGNITRISPSGTVSSSATITTVPSPTVSAKFRLGAYDTVNKSLVVIDPTVADTADRCVEYYADGSKTTLSATGGTTFLNNLKNDATRYVPLTARSATNSRILPFSSYTGQIEEGTYPQMYGWLETNGSYAEPTPWVNITNGTSSSSNPTNQHSNQMLCFADQDTSGTGQQNFCKISPNSWKQRGVRTSNNGGGGSLASQVIKTEQLVPASYLVEVYSDEVGTVLLDSFVLYPPAGWPEPHAYVAFTNSGSPWGVQGALNLFPAHISFTNKKVLWMGGTIRELDSGNSTLGVSAMPYWAVCSLEGL